MSTHPDDVYGSLDPVSRLRMDLQRGLANLQAGNPAQALQEEDPVALEPLPKVPMRTMASNTSLKQQR